MGKYTDNFNRANGGLGSDWERYYYDDPRYLVISTNEVTGNVASVYCANKYIAGTINSNHYSQVEYRSGSDPFYVGVRAISGDAGKIDFVDDFTRADENPLSGGGNWTTVSGYGDLELVSNTIVGTTAAVYNRSYYSGGTLTNDQFIEYYYSSGSGNMGCCLRYDLSTSYRYEVISNAGTGTFKLRKITSGGTFDLWDSGGVTWSAGDFVTFYAYGTSLEVYRNGVFQAQVTDSDVTAGKAVMSLFGDAVFVDNLWLGDIEVQDRFWHLRYSGSGLQLRRTCLYNHLVWSDSTTLSAGDTIRLSAEGTLYLVYKNSTLLTTQSNTWWLPSGGRPILSVLGTSTKVDNWAGGDAGILPSAASGIVLAGGSPTMGLGVRPPGAVRIG